MAYQPDQTQTLLWHDYETFGLDPRWDRPSQFAAIRTDLDFNQIGESMMWYCRPADDYLPSPSACLVTGVTPQKCLQEGVPEVEFMALINEQMSKPGTCSLGYNSLRFDDEFTRFGLYRNLFDVYAREWQGGNSRWDLIDLVRTAAAIRPEGINWPRNEAGELVLKLDRLAPANGIEHADAHDALADVRATIELARLLKKSQPRLYNYVFQLKHKAQVWGQLDLQMRKPVLHVSSTYGRENGYLSLVGAFAKHPSNNNAVLVFDLRQDPRIWQGYSSAQLQELLFSRKDLLPVDAQRPAVKEIQVNKCPVVSPLQTLSDEQATSFSVDKTQCLKHLQYLREDLNLCEALSQAYSNRPDFPVVDPDAGLYGGGFFNDKDRKLMEKVHQSDPSIWSEGEFSFTDNRLEAMLFRLKARNYPHLLSGDEMQAWEAFRSERLLDASASGARTYEHFAKELNELGQKIKDPAQIAILEELHMYAESIYPMS
ncbi:exodeoxyribonuclease I [Oceanospirillaceae bacterium]|uniref:exodeoxyribonuclease I n=1 Tax=Candidatus Njordibacter sp. Uisw_002 TaxID=3230971 RepID=UPI002374F656|nr:exodeoxyribonuclease I [Oceanospirillaceae bacterium]MDC1340298.1 exodeoxyribonuclease I [Oceanospirillaceae bacterium]